ncbi:MAG TPA: hypothetical protein VNI79_07410 [Sphingomicrobium sp.]|nr:hypothetical protein [Sphingomicrobium sp.]
MALVVAAGVLLRVMWLDRLTGINGDEAWYGALAQRWAAGDLTLWRTPSGNFPGPLQPTMVMLGQFILPGEFLVLRIPTVLSSLIAMALAWRIGKQHFDVASGRLALLVMAVIPANIAYARFGWDPSHSGMMILVGVSLALARRLTLTSLTFALALWTHPTNVFAAPFLLLIFAAAERLSGDLRLLAPRVAVLTLLMSLFTLAMMTTASQAGKFVEPEAILGRLASPDELLTFVLLLGRLMAGEPWFIALAGSGYGVLMPLIDTIGLAAIAGMLWFTVRTVSRGGLSLSGGVMLGWLATVLSYALVAGHSPLNAPTERYAFVLIAPTALALALTLRAVVASAVGTWREAVLITATGAAFLVATIALYLVPLATRDLRMHVAFRTGPVEPKQAAARWIGADARRRGPALVVAENWWLYWPLAYRLAGQGTTMIDVQAQPHAAARAVGGRRLDVVFAGSRSDAQLRARGTARLAWTSRGSDGRAIVRVWESGIKS